MGYQTLKEPTTKIIESEECLNNFFVWGGNLFEKEPFKWRVKYTKIVSCLDTNYKSISYHLYFGAGLDESYKQLYDRVDYLVYNIKCRAELLDKILCLPFIEKEAWYKR